MSAQNDVYIRRAFYSPPRPECYASTQTLKIQFGRTEVLISLIVDELLLTLLEEQKQHAR